MQELLRRAVRPLLEWYGANRRELPWRGESDFYRVLVSEIMLQQTRVEAVKEYYIRFLERFPTAESLSLASEEEVLKAWEGLGYYTRARNLKKAAAQLTEHVPETFEETKTLCGVGEYTAGSLSSIVLNLPCPAVDGNVLRVLTRLLADESLTDLPETREKFRLMLKAVYPKEASDFCQALMELGAIVCVPNGAPLCGRCPWEGLCLAHAQGREECFPVKSPKKARRVEEYDVAVLECGGEYALKKRDGKGLLAGLWQFPTFPKGSVPNAFGSAERVKEAKHIFTHVEWRMTGYLIRAEKKFPEFVWASAEEIAKNYALPSAFKAFLEWLK